MGKGEYLYGIKKLDNEYISVLASLCFLNTVFFKLKIFNKSFVQILKNNSRAINFNRSLGYVLLPNQEKFDNQYYVLTKEDYEAKTMKLQKVAAKLTGDYDLPRIIGSVSDKNLAEINELIQYK
jgi:hypothetical protein